MTRGNAGRLALAALLIALSAPANAQKADRAAVEEHVANATKAARNDLLGPLALCKAATPTPGPSFFDSYKAMAKEPPLEPMQVMDELYFVGAKWTLGGQNLRRARHYRFHG